MRAVIVLILLVIFCQSCRAQLLPGFKISENFDEQQMVIENLLPDTHILVNAPLKGFEKGEKVLLVFYALPNGNNIGRTFGKRLKEGDELALQHSAHRGADKISEAAP